MATTHIQKSFCTTREAAEILGISLRTAQLWVESGQLEAWKTEGGHRRIARVSIERLLANPPVPAALATGNADHADHAKPECLGGEDRFTQRVRAFVGSTPSFSVYSLYSAV